MTKFKDGDRVAVYHGPLHKGSKGTVTSIVPGGDLHIAFDKHSVQIIVQPQQCRKLVKKPHIRFWAHERHLRSPNGKHITMYYHGDPAEGMVEFVEVRRKKS